MLAFDFISTNVMSFPLQESTLEPLVGHFGPCDRPLTLHGYNHWCAWPSNSAFVLFDCKRKM